MDLVYGEASESDEEFGVPSTPPKIAILASEILGEATESDDDIYYTSDSTIKSTTGNKYNNNLLQRKLIESNITIWKELTNTIKDDVTTASVQLLNTEQLLIKSQVSMQAALTYLKQSQENVKDLLGKSNFIFTSNFISPIEI
ncbi:biogenesis of lysosome-related organelles complex 1 subunit 3-like [Teleopsis dalmanni]|uniref:biogenesis of lysosome-related organelles complex 1 subunit 3-like n=1 Tax=Teleopsis dalmanni TaxID=139649 RepID=UPI0018CCF00B|nr:biogenesis of lysosome-related organelles complex 1 subunit 3-like [Teleopsis dalmanni]XP_037935229.1 biogenesis of lysosome-related organelles complex 1 subunit 3-like [Teleopsis dalmanni]